MQPTRFGRRPTLAPVIVALAFAAFAASALAGSSAVRGAYVINGSITSADPVTNGPRYTTTRSTCAVAPTPADLVGAYHYKVYSFKTISSIARCVTVSLTVSSGSAVAAAYYQHFIPSSPPTGFLGSTGGWGAGQAGDFEFAATCCGGPGGVFDVVVYETTPGGGATYTLLVEGLGVLTSSGGPTAATDLQSFRAKHKAKSTVVSWRTRSEQNTTAFNVYRGDGAKPVRLTPRGIPAAGDPRGHSYTYIDHSPTRGKQAHYWLQVVPVKGQRLMYGPAHS